MEQRQGFIQKVFSNLERDEYWVYELRDGSYNTIHIGHVKILSSLLKHFEDGTYPITEARLFSVEKPRQQIFSCLNPVRLTFNELSSRVFSAPENLDGRFCY